MVADSEEKVWTRQESMHAVSMQRDMITPNMVRFFKFLSQMEWQNSLEETMKSENPLLRGIDLKRREEIRGDLQGNSEKSHMTQKPAMILGQSKGISCIVIASNLEFSSMCRRKKLSRTTEIQ